MDVEAPEEETSDRISIFDLPTELIQIIISYLTLEEICKLGATCRFGHSITHDEGLWGMQVQKQLHLLFGNSPSGLFCSRLAERINLAIQGPRVEGIICDPSVQGNRELAVIYSPEFKKLMIERNERKKDPFRTLLENSLKDMLPKLLAFYVSLPQEEQCSARLVLFGPGIESPNTKFLVHKIVSARSSTFDAVEFIKGLPGGIGSGVRINYKHMYNFDLMCLYTNSQANRERLYVDRLQGRLSPQLNRMLVEDKEKAQGVALQPSILKLLPTIHSLVFAVDTALEDKSVMEAASKVIRQELNIMIQSLSEFQLNLPLVVLAVRNETNGAGYFLSINDIIQGLQLDQLSCAWGVFEVVVENMKGVEKALDWVLYHLSKKRRDIKYHTEQGQSQTS